ncbi:MAG: hypothetical protein QM705_14170 [Ancrocorticia sp.]
MSEAMNQETNRTQRGWRLPNSTELVLDLRTWIAAMFATFGTMLAVYGAFFATPEDIAKGAGINLNLWTGVGLLVVALLFAIWLLAKPSAVDESGSAKNVD